MSQFVPTILIGVGGIGSHIVDQVKSKLPKKTLEFIAFHTFDTNINDIKNLENLTSEDITQTSTDLIVEEYLKLLDEKGETDYLDWFPHQNGEILKRSMTEGAGQVRAISRLALKSALTGKGLAKLMKSFNRIFKQGESTLQLNPRVMIVSSLAGGTGAGVFLQVGLLIRKILQDRYGKSPLIRGTFLLPDVLVNSGTMTDPNQIENMRANAYACLKELDGFIVANSGEEDNSFIAELEYMPDQKKENGVYHVDEKPYDFSLLYDFENLNGSNLQYFENYQQLVIESIYTDLMTPIGDKIYSQQDNRILDIIEKKGRNRYCSSAVTKIVYPYDDIVALGAYHKVVGELEEEWLFVDEQINEEIRAQRASVKSGITLPEVKKGKRFIDIMKDESEKTNPKPFLLEAFRAIFIKIADRFGSEHLGPSFAQELVKNIGEEISRLISQNSEINYVKDQVNNINADDFRKKGLAENSIAEKEGYLQMYKSKIQNYVNGAANQLAKEILFKDKSKEIKYSDTPYTLNYWFLKDQGLHPLSMRLLLYNIIDILQTELTGGLATYDNSIKKGLSTECLELENKIKNYERIYDDPDTEDYVENAVDRVNTITQKKFSLFGKDLKDFAENYEEASSSLFDNLNTYLNSKFTLLVFERLLADVNKLSELWENYFNGLEAVNYEMASKRNNLFVKHKESNPVIRYIFSQQEMKTKLLDEVLPSISFELPSEIRKNLYIRQYNRWMNVLDGRKANISGEELRKMIESDLVGNYTKILMGSPALDMNVIEAAKKEAIYSDKDEFEHIESITQTINGICLPLIKPNNLEGGIANSIKVWGVSTAVKNSLNDAQFNQMFSDGSVLVHDFFNSKEIIRSLTLFGLVAADLPKFGKDGVYRRAYDHRIAILNGQVKNFVTGEVLSTVTPHLDTRWHLYSYLTNIGESKSEVYHKAFEAMILGLSNKVIIHTASEKSYRWLINNAEIPYELKNSTSNRKVNGDLYSLFTELCENIGLSNEISGKATSDLIDEVNRDASNFKKNTTFKGLSEINYQGETLNMLEIIYHFLDKQAVTEESEGKGVLMLKTMFEIIEKIISTYKPSLDEGELDKLLKEQIDKLKGASQYTSKGSFQTKITALIS